MFVVRELVPVLFIIFLSVMTLSSADHQLQVNTIYGNVQGKLMKSREGREFSAFLGIPYAAVPIGPLRFMPPEPPKAWEGVRNSTEEDNVCIQRDGTGKEDCLYLNVFTHDSKETLPVMVYIHGGGFVKGSNSLSLCGPEYLMDKNIVLVTIQYRLGVFGFLSTEDSVVPGNMGLKDQVRALQWVQENIRAFGGDPKQVTIFGHSAGSISVHLHMLSPASKDLFARAISQGGAAKGGILMLVKGSAKKITNQLAKNLNCSNGSSEDVIQCLQRLDSLKIQQEYTNIQDSNYDFIKSVTRPVIEEPSEKSFITHSALYSPTNKPWLVGFNSNEGIFKVKIRSLNHTIDLINQNFSNFGPAILFFDDTSTIPKETAQSIYDFYFKNISSTDMMITAIERMISDAWFVWPTYEAIKQHNGTLFCYLFEHSGQESWIEMKRFGVGHGEELRYLFTQTKYFPMNMTTEDTNISKLLIELWTGFAAGQNSNRFLVHSNPQNGSSALLTWVATSSTDPAFLHIETENVSLVNNVFKDRVDFWKSLPVQDKIHSSV